MQKHRFGGRLRLLLSHTDPVALWTGLFLVLYLLFPGRHGYSGISREKTLLYYGFMGLLIILIAVTLTGEQRHKTLRPLTPVQLAAVIYLFCTFLSAALSPFGRLAWYNRASHEGAVTVGLYVLMFLAVSRRGKTGWTLFWAFSAAVAVFCGICVLQAVGRNPLRLYPAGTNYYDGKGVRYNGLFAGTVGNVDLVSALLAMAVPILLGSALRLPRKKSWPVFLLTAVIVGVLLWLQVLCGLVGLAFGGAVCLLVLCNEKARKWLIAAYIFLAVAAVTLLWCLDCPVKFLHELHELLHGRVEDSFGSGRIYIWRQMLHRVPDRLLFGVGPDMARFSGLAPFVRYDNAGAVAAKATITDAHCLPLQILYCQGLPALLSWLALVGMVIHHWLRGRKNGTVAVLGSGIVCFLFAMLFCFSSIIIMPFLWLALGLLEAAHSKE